MTLPRAPSAIPNIYLLISEAIVKTVKMSAVLMQSNSKLSVQYTAPRQRTNAEGKYKVETVTWEAGIKVDENKCSGTFFPLGAARFEAPKSPFKGGKSLTTKSKSGICE